jgi:hypothetical protein
MGCLLLFPQYKKVLITRQPKRKLKEVKSSTMNKLILTLTIALVMNFCFGQNSKNMEGCFSKEYVIVHKLNEEYVSGVFSYEDSLVLVVYEEDLFIELYSNKGFKLKKSFKGGIDLLAKSFYYEGYLFLISDLSNIVCRMNVSTMSMDTLKISDENFQFWETMFMKNNQLLITSGNGLSEIENWNKDNPTIENFKEVKGDNFIPFFTQYFNDKYIGVGFDNGVLNLFTDTEEESIYFSLDNDEEYVCDIYVYKESNLFVLSNEKLYWFIKNDLVGSCNVGTLLSSRINNVVVNNRNIVLATSKELVFLDLELFIPVPPR